MSIRRFTFFCDFGQGDEPKSTLNAFVLIFSRYKAFRYSAKQSRLSEPRIKASSILIELYTAKINTCREVRVLI